MRINGSIIGSVVTSSASSAIGIWGLQNVELANRLNIWPAQIVTSGLVLFLDASNIDSYPGTGTTWKDLSGNNNNGTLTNGPTFSSANGGSIVFDGTNDNVSFNNSGTSTPFDFANGNMTCMFWMIPSAWGDGASRGVISKKANDSTNGWVIYNDGFYPTKLNARLGLGNNFVTSTSVSTSVYQCWTLTRSSTTLTWYCNGVLDSTGTNTSNISDTTVELQVSRSQTWNGYFKGNISNVLFYNRSLTAIEVLQNYNATKSRFGI